MTAFTGTDGDDVLPPVGGDNSGDDSFFGLGGNDVIHAGSGHDTVDASSGNDLVYGENGNDTLFGGSGDDRLYGGNDGDVLLGGDGNDIINGNGGAGGDSLGDLMAGGLGNDTYYVDNESDSVSESADSGVDKVYSSVTFTAPESVENLILTGSANIDAFGNGGNDKLTGNQGVNTLAGADGNDVLNGKAGADTMSGGHGNDSYHVDNAGDVIDEEEASGIDNVSSSISFSLLASANLMGDIENLTLTGTADLDGVGNGLNNIITGNAGDNALTGNDGADTLKGGSGNDTLTGGLAADKLTGGLHADTFTLLAITDSTVAGPGRDTILDFKHAQGDKIDVSQIDADSTASGDQAFAFVAAASFSGTAGELRAVVTNGSTVVTGDLDGDRVADFGILVKGVTSLQASDFTF